ncbi:MAG: hypothetical protein SPE00_03820 [Bacilli bacterium]|nr:hypothetical protein [Bacilli bacterium]
MVAVAGVLFLFIILLIGLGLIIPAIVGLVICKNHEKKNGKKIKLIFKILLWILLVVGIVVIAIPLMYFYLIIANW